MDTEPTLTGASATVVIVPAGIARVDAGRRLAASLISADQHQADLVQRGIHPDLMELVPATGKEKIGIDRIRDVIRRGQFSPVQGERKVCVIPYGEALTPEAENALLKVLEEPTPYIAFVILVGDPGDLLPTVRSRSCIVRLPPPSSTTDQLAAAGYSAADAHYLRDTLTDLEIATVQADHVDVTARRDEARNRAENANGDELCALVTGGGIAAREAGTVLISRVVDGDPATLVTMAHTLAKRGRDDGITFLELMLQITFTALRSAVGLMPAYPDPSVTAIARRLGVDQLITVAQAVEEARRAIDGYTPVEPVLLWLFLTIAGVIDDG